MTGRRVLAFTAAGVACAAEPSDVDRILPIGPLLPAPSAPRWLVGLVEVRGTVRAVVDVGRRLFPEAADPLAPRFLLVGSFDGTPCALAVTDVAGIVPASPGAEAAEGAFPPTVRSLLRGTVTVDGQQRVLLDVAGLVSAVRGDVDRAAGRPL